MTGLLTRRCCCHWRALSMSHPVHCRSLPSLSTCRAPLLRRCLPGRSALAPDGSTRRPVGGRAEFGSWVVSKQPRPEFRSEWPMTPMTPRWHCVCLARFALPPPHPTPCLTCRPGHPAALHCLFVCRRSFHASLPPHPCLTCRPGHPAAHGAPLQQDGVHRRRRLP